MNITLEESTTEIVPPLLHEIMRKLVSENVSHEAVQKDYLFILIVVLMIEGGFHPVNKEYELIDPKKEIDSVQIGKWKSSVGIVEVPFVLTGFEIIPLKLIMSSLGATVVVNILIADLNADTYSLCLPVSRYVVSPQASTIPMIFRDLKHLSTTFKNKILVAVKSRILNHCGYPCGSLVGLPEELFYNIILYLPICDIISIGKTNRRMRHLLENQSLWRELYKRDFSTNYFNMEHSDENDWKLLYIKKYKEDQDNIRGANRSAGTMHDFMDYSDFVAYIDNPMWDII